MSQRTDRAVLKVTRLKHERVVEALERDIRAGRLRYGDQLPGENTLAQRFKVSRNTVRAALSELGDAGLLTTRTGKRSFVIFDGRVLDDRHGWARALRDSGVELSTEVPRLTRPHDPELAQRLASTSTEFVAIDRVRAPAAGGPGVSLERGRVPLTERTEGIPRAGLTGGSLTRTLTDAGLVPAHSEQWVPARSLDRAEAALQRRATGEMFLAVRRADRARDGELVEHVDSLLDPAHVELHHTF